MRLIDELNTFYNTSSRILDLTNGRLPPVHMITELSIASLQLPCNTSIYFSEFSCLTALRYVAPVSLWIHTPDTDRKE